ncbi:hypothetical protein AGMMS50229_07830 [Campylobacterota bacterium]|nr:hypothetical protein AGMMS50229_07830 [Campylobacterota bacterium]
MNEKQIEVVSQFMRLQTLMNSHQKRLGGTPYSGQGRVLSLLKENPQITQKELTALFGMTKQATAQLLDKLEKGGYIARETSETDRRVSVIVLTEAGALAASEMEIDIAAHDRGSELGCLNDAELDALSGYLGRIINSFEQLGKVRGNHENGIDRNV